MKILFLVPYPLKASPSQRFRFEQYLELLSQRGAMVHVESFLNSQTWLLFYENGKTSAKILALLGGCVRRLVILFQMSSFDFVFIHREAAPVGPPLLEWLISKVLKKKIIYDFDDAIWMTDKTDESPVEKILRFRQKVKTICRWSYKVSCGNKFLCEYAEQVSTKVFLNPTTIDTHHLHNRLRYREIKANDFIVIGWTGSHSTIKYLLSLERVLQHLEKKYTLLRILVIADQHPQLNLSSLQFRPWSIDSEIEDLLGIDIGLMPLPDDEWSKGKCGFKALQYMALGIPAIASAVGVNTDIISNGFNGFLCSSEKEWIDKLELLIQDAELRLRMGKEGRKTVEENYSVNANASNFFSLFE